MVIEKVVKALAATCLLVLLAPSLLHAELTRDDKRAIKQALKGETFYLRTDAPAKVGFTGFGLSFDPLVEVSPRGVTTDYDRFSFFGDGISWNVRINHHVEIDDVDIDEDDGEIEIEVDTIAEDSDHSVILLVGIYSLDDFHDALGHAFAKVPLQDEHPEWSEEIRQAIADRELRPGMNRRQAHYIVGHPQRVEESTEGGTDIVVWVLRADAVRVGRVSGPSGMPESLRFEDGVLVDVDDGVDANGGLELDG